MNDCTHLTGGYIYLANISLIPWTIISLKIDILAALSYIQHINILIGPTIDI